MANTVTLVKGPTGQSGPNAVGEQAEEVWQCVGDGSTPNIAITPNWIRMVLFYDCSPGITVTGITFPTGFTAFPAPSFTIQCAAPPSTFPVFITVRGIWR